MKIISESQLRAQIIAPDTKQYKVDSNTFVTPSAKEYLAQRGITLVVEQRADVIGAGVMTRTALPDGESGYVDFETGAKYHEKPEYMTHLYSNVLVSKTHPNILFRGKLDTLEAMIMETQITALDEGCEDIVCDLQEVLDFTRRLLACEVKNEPVGEFILLGMNSADLRRVSHNVDKEFGVEHPIPDCRMGKMCVRLNTLRAFVRETELCATNAFCEHTDFERADIIEALNRLSSCVYIIFCKTAAKHHL